MKQKILSILGRFFDSEMKEAASNAADEIIAAYASQSPALNVVQVNDLRKALEKIRDMDADNLADQIFSKEDFDYAGAGYGFSQAIACVQEMAIKALASANTQQPISNSFIKEIQSIIEENKADLSEAICADDIVNASATVECYENILELYKKYHAESQQPEAVKSGEQELTASELKELLRLAFESGKNTGLYRFSNIEHRERVGATPYYHFFEEWFKAVISTKALANAANKPDNGKEGVE